MCKIRAVGWGETCLPPKGSDVRPLWCQTCCPLSLYMNIRVNIQGDKCGDKIFLDTTSSTGQKSMIGGIVDAGHVDARHVSEEVSAKSQSMHGSSISTRRAIVESRWDSDQKRFQEFGGSKPPFLFSSPFFFPPFFLFLPPLQTETCQKGDPPGGVRLPAIKFITSVCV